MHVRLLRGKEKLIGEEAEKSRFKCWKNRRVCRDVKAGT